MISTSPTVESWRTVGSPFMTARAGGARRGSRSTPDLARRGLLRLVSGALEHGQPGVLVEARIDLRQGAAPEHAALGLDAPGMPAGEAQPYPRAPESVSGVIGQATSPRRDRRMSMCPSLPARRSRKACGPEGVHRSLLGGAWLSPSDPESLSRLPQTMGGVTRGQGRPGRRPKLQVVAAQRIDPAPPGHADCGGPGWGLTQQQSLLRTKTMHSTLIVPMIFFVLAGALTASGGVRVETQLIASLGLVVVGVAARRHMLR